MGFGKKSNVSKTKKRLHTGEVEYILKLHYYLIHKKGKRLNELCKYIRDKTGGKFSKYFFYNIFRGRLIFCRFSTLLFILEYLETDFTTIEKIKIPEKYRRKYIK